MHHLPLSPVSYWILLGERGASRCAPGQMPWIGIRLSEDLVVFNMHGMPGSRCMGCEGATGGVKSA
jgi:hypothetical protein